MGPTRFLGMLAAQAGTGLLLGILPRSAQPQGALGSYRRGSGGPWLWPWGPAFLDPELPPILTLGVD